MDDAAIAILAGGAATRFPGKLECEVGGEPLLLRVYARVRGTWPVYVIAKGSFAHDIDARLDCPVFVDRWPGRGPLAALLTACGMLRQRYVFAVGADLPNVDRALLEGLAQAHRAGDEAIVPEHDGRMEPLAALYDRDAVLREGFAVLRHSRGAMRELLGRLQARAIALPRASFVNLNTPADLEAAL